MTNLLRLEVVENNNGLEITNLSKREDLQKMDATMKGFMIKKAISWLLLHFC